VAVSVGFLKSFVFGVMLVCGRQKHTSTKREWAGGGGGAGTWQRKAMETSLRYGTSEKHLLLHAKENFLLDNSFYLQVCLSSLAISSSAAYFSPFLPPFLHCVMWLALFRYAFCFWRSGWVFFCRAACEFLWWWTGYVFCSLAFFFFFSPSRVTNGVHA
jgi:hypothetical protein